MGEVVNMEGGEIKTAITAGLRELADDIDAGKLKAKRVFYIVEDEGIHDLEIRYAGEPCDKASVVGVFATATNLLIKNLAGS